LICALLCRGLKQNLHWAFTPIPDLFDLCPVM